MVHDDYYTINLSFNDRKVEVAPQEFSFSMADSIYSLYNFATFELNDITGLLQEYFSTTEGAGITLGYGTKEYVNTCKYVIKKDDLPEIKTPGFLSGDVNAELVNHWYGKQEVKSKAYENSIATIVSQLTGGGGFTSLDIEDTGNFDFWYQPMITDAKFIQEALLPSAYSPKSNTPFYAYITSDDIFHLKSFNSMITTNPTETIEYRTQNPKTKNPNQTIHIRKMHQSSDEHRNLLKRNLFKISRVDGSLIEDTDGIGSYPPQGAKTIPIMNFGDMPTGYMNLGFDDTEAGKSENKEGAKINSTKKSAIIDRFLILQPLNPKLKSGNLVQLNIYSSENDGDALSTHYSGKYVIENSEHIWNSKELRGYTKILVGRKYTKILPGNYLLKPVLM